MTLASGDIDIAPEKGRTRHFLSMLAADPFASASAIFLLLLVIAALIGPQFLGAEAGMNLRMRNAPPFQLDRGILYILGGDALGRPILPRLLSAAQTTLLIALSVVFLSAGIGTLLGIIAGYFGRFIDTAVMRFADVVMSFPSLLLAVIVLYMLEPMAANLVLVLAVTRLPVYIRVARAEVLEVRERLFVEAARSIGASDFRIVLRHIVPVVLPTMFTVATLDIANVMLSESALSFLGIGIQPPGVTWGLMVASGRNYLATAWWLAFWPGLAIMLTALAANLLANWLRIAMDPKLNWRLEKSLAKPDRRGAPPAVNGSSSQLLEIRDLQVEFHTGGKVIHAVNGVDIALSPGETVAILGESGSGKSVTFDAVLGTLEIPPGRISNGAVFFKGRNLLKLPPRERRRHCGRDIALIFQDPLSSLNPVYTVGWQIAEMCRVHRGLSRSDAHQKAIALLEQVGIPGAANRVNDYPHQFSGGMRQRVVIAMALAADPQIVIADEPTTALDATVEAQILTLLRRLQRERNMGLIFITHSMGVAAEIADRLVVMYAGRIMESGNVRDIFRRPAHPYTRGLMNSIPRRGRSGQRLVPIFGQPPDQVTSLTGCAFAARCPMARDICRSQKPELESVHADHLSACHFRKEVLSS